MLKQEVGIGDIIRVALQITSAQDHIVNTCFERWLGYSVS